MSDRGGGLEGHYKPVGMEGAESTERPFAALLDQRRRGTVPVMSSATSAPR
jgi:hypothetical protein